MRDLTSKGRWSTYDVGVLKLSNVSMFHSGEMRMHGKHSKLPSPTKLARLGHFPPASQEGRLAGPVFYIFSLRYLYTAAVKQWSGRGRVAPPIQPFVQNNLEINSDMKSAKDVLQYIKEKSLKNPRSCPS
jgi:hypothetical protein